MKKLLQATMSLLIPIAHACEDTMQNPNPTTPEEQYNLAKKYDDGEGVQQSCILVYQSSRAGTRKCTKRSWGLL